MNKKTKPRNFMDLAEARRVGGRPIVARMPRWRRAFRILVRWAEEPCTKKEFEKRLRLCRNVYQCITEVEAATLEKENRYVKARHKKR